MKKKFLKVFVLVLVWLLVFIGSATTVIYRVAKTQNEEYIANGHIENIELENESFDNNTIPETTILETKEIKDNEQTNESVISTIAENKTNVNTTTKSTTTVKTNTQIQTNENNTQTNTKTQTVNNPQTTTQTQQKPQTETKVEQPKSTETSKIEEKQKCVGNKHSIPTGNSNKWFNSEDEAFVYYKSLIKEWGDKLESFKDFNSEEYKVFNEEYNKNCPCRYEAYTCTCGKVTIDFEYRG